MKTSHELAVTQTPGVQVLLHAYRAAFPYELLKAESLRFT